MPSSNEYMRTYRKKNLEKVRTIARKSYHKRKTDNPEFAESLKWYQRQARHGITKSGFMAMLIRQHSRCAGCNRQLEINKSTHIDHSHATGNPRGLLCVRCNFALGYVQDRRDILYQLAAYLEIDRSNPVIYVIGSLRNPNIPQLGNDIRALGMEAVDNWWATGEIADDTWNKYSDIRGRSYKEALQSREAVHTFNFDKAYLNLADAVVMLFPAGKSAGLEFGYAIGQGKRGYILIEGDVGRYEVMAQFASVVVFREREALLEQLKKDFILCKT